MTKQPIIVAMDLEGVLVPEIWIAFAEKTGIPELKLTTRDISDYDVLMKHRIGILKKNNLKLSDVQEVIATMEPYPGAVEFINWLKENYQLVILSDTFYEFASPLMRKLEWPPLYCNTIVTDNDDNIIDYKMRILDGKRHAVLAFKQLNFQVFAMGDSYNDVSMIMEADCGMLFRPSEKVAQPYKDLKIAVEYAEIMENISNMS